VSVALVVVAGLFVSTFSHLMQVPLGFDRRETLLVTIRTPTVPGIERNALYHPLVKAVAAVPGVEFAGGSMNAPLVGTLNGDFVVSQPGTSPPPGTELLKQSDSSRLECSRRSASRSTRGGTSTIAKRRSRRR
jgi:hypothetical protein